MGTDSSSIAEKIDWDLLEARLAIENERSGPHRWAEHVLDKAGISYMSEYEMGPYHVDLYLPAVHAAVEIDGPYHSKPADERRDGWLFSSCYMPTLHIPAKGAWRATFIPRVEAFMAMWTRDYDERLTQWRSSR